MATFETFRVTPPELMPGEDLRAKYDVRMKKPEGFGLPQLIITLVLLCCVVLPGIIYLVYWYFMRSEGKGIFFLTTHRLIYREAIWGPKKTNLTTLSIALPHINSIEIKNIHLRDSKGFEIFISTSYYEALHIGGVKHLSGVVGQSFEPDVDASKAMDELYANIVELRS